MAASAAVVLAAGALAWWVRERPDDAPGAGLDLHLGGFGVTGARERAGHALQIGIMAPYRGTEDPETLTFRSATAHLSEDTAGAVATLSVCLPRGSRNGDLGGGGAVSEPTLTRFCRTARPVVEGTTMQWGTESAAGEFLVLTIRSTRPGRAQVDSFTLDYRRDEAHGGGRFVERTEGQEFVLRAR